MNIKIKDIDIKKHTHYFFDDIINIKNFDPNKTKIDEKSHKNIFIILNWIYDDQRFEIREN